ncbi:hypothetical protein [Parapedobacter soli]|uniref:hypothetical protein n=1 Tax=Parapedobacter soli TaxID=416955 RepID=UPI0021C5E452|nr:hypothetical protein [Parapedobacter soli]
MEKILKPQSQQKKQPAVLKTVSSEAKNRTFTPSRFSVRRLRKHPGIQTSRNPHVIG